MLELDAVGRRFGALWAVRDVTFAVAPAEIVGIIGPNGAGKSTLFNLIAGAITPSAGSIRFLDHNITTARPYHVARLGLARTFQIPKPFKQLTVRENIMLSALRRHRTPRKADPVTRTTMEFIGIAHLADVPASNLTVGLLKKLEVARALATEPSLLLLDEVMAGAHASEVKEMMAVDRRLAGARHHRALGRACDDGDHERGASAGRAASGPDHRPGLAARMSPAIPRS